MFSPNKIRVILADRHEVFREGLQLILKKERDFEVIGSVDNTDDVINMAYESQADIFVIDIDLPTTDGLDCAKELRQHFPESKIVILTHNACDRCVRSAFESRVNGYVLKDIEVNSLVSALRMVYNGGLVFNPDVTYRQPLDLINQDSENPRLNPRELEILLLAAKGNTNKLIANKLRISNKTVSSHLFNVFKKLGVESRTEAVLVALKMGFFNFEDLDAKDEQINEQSNQDS